MKRITYISLFLLTGLGLWGCKKEIATFNGAEGIYFAVQWGPEHGNLQVWAMQSYTPVEFVNIAGNTDTLHLKVMTTGPVKNYDRTFGLTVDPDSTTAVEGINFEKLEQQYVVKAGTLYTDIPVVLKRSDNIQTIEKTLGLKLLPGKDFTLSIPVWRKLPGMWDGAKKGDINTDHHKVVISDFISKPARWIGMANGGVEAGLWGDFTVKKYRLICEMFGLAYSDFLTEESMPSAKRTVIGEYMARYLQRLYDEGKPILEDDGRLMYFSGVSWTSKIGVPYKP